MSYTLFDATLDLSRKIQDTFESWATSIGTTTTLIDSQLFQGSGWFSDAPKGTLWLKLTTKAFKNITAFAGNTITFSPAQAAAIAVNDRYAAAPPQYPLYALISAVNQALREIGATPAEKSVTAVAGQQSYTNSDDTVFDEDIIGVEIANASGSPYNWTPHDRWHQIPSATRTLIFDEGTEPPNAYPMRIFYLKQPTELSVAADVISSYIHPKRLLWEAVVAALRWRYQRSKTDDASIPALLNEGKDAVGKLAAEQMQSSMEKVGAVAAENMQIAMANALQMANLYPIQRQRSPRHSRW